MRTHATATLATLLLSAASASAGETPSLTAPQRIELTASAPSYFEERNQRVQHAFLRFAHEANQDGLCDARARDQLRLGTIETASPIGGASLGAALFGAATVLAAHAPASVRAIVDGQMHLGPALFDGGGIGAGVGMRF